MSFSPDEIFKVANTIPMFGWLLLTFVPKWKYTKFIVFNFIVVLLGSIYLALVVTHIGDSKGDFGSLSGVMTLFQSPYAVVAGWVHYLAFDLSIGLFIAQNAQKYGINHYLLVVPCLFFTLMFGPVGLLMYLIIRTIKTRQYLLPVVE